MKNFLFPTNLLDGHGKALKCAYEFSQKHDAKLHLLHVTWPTGSIRRPIMDKVSFIEEERQEFIDWANKFLPADHNVQFPKRK